MEHGLVGAHPKFTRRGKLSCSFTRDRRASGKVFNVEMRSLEPVKLLASYGNCMPLAYSENTLREKYLIWQPGRRYGPLVFFCLVLVAMVPSTKAQLAFDETSLEAQAKIEDTTAQMEFRFKNIGKRPVLIKKLQTSCGCTTATVEKQIYLPGSTGKVVATVKIGSLHGTIEKTVLVQTDDPDDPDIKLSVRVSAPSLAELSTASMQWAEAKKYDDQIVKVSILNTLPIKVTGLKSWADSFHASLVVINEGKDYEVHVKTADGTMETISAVELLTDIPNPDLRTRVWIFLRIEHSPATPPAATQPIR